MRTRRHAANTQTCCTEEYRNEVIITLKKTKITRLTRFLENSRMYKQLKPAVLSTVASPIAVNTGYEAM